MCYVTEVEGATTERVQLAVLESPAAKAEMRWARKERSRLKRDLDRSGSGVDSARAIASVPDKLAQFDYVKLLKLSCAGRSTRSRRRKQ